MQGLEHLHTNILTPTLLVLPPLPKTCTQYIASSLFLLEAIGVCVLHLFNDQWRPLLTSVYFWYLTVLAVGGIVSVAFYDPLRPSTGFKVVIPLLQVRDTYVLHF